MPSPRPTTSDNIIDVYFGNAADDWDKVGTNIFKKQLWQCMIGQALVIKSNIENRRKQNQFGIIVWQYNESEQSLSTTGPGAAKT